MSVYIYGFKRKPRQITLAGDTSGHTVPVHSLAFRRGNAQDCFSDDDQLRRSAEASVNAIYRAWEGGDGQLANLAEIRYFVETSKSGVPEEGALVYATTRPVTSPVWTDDRAYPGRAQIAGALVKRGGKWTLERCFTVARRECQPSERLPGWPCLREGDPRFPAVPDQDLSYRQAELVRLALIQERDTPLHVFEVVPAGSV